MRSVYKWRFVAPSSAWVAAPEKPCPYAPLTDSLTRGIDMLAGCGRLSERQVSGYLWALQLWRRRDDRTRGSCWQVCRPGSVATRWEHLVNPLVDLEKVRAFATRHICTHPSHCLIHMCVPIRLGRSHAVGRPSGGPCVGAGCAAAAAQRAVAAATFLAGQKVCHGP